jgi:hypothetical protein
VLTWAVIAVVWLLAALGSGAALAWLYKRLYPALAFYKLWALWTMLLSAVVALLLGLGMI